MCGRPAPYPRSHEGSGAPHTPPQMLPSAPPRDAPSTALSKPLNSLQCLEDWLRSSCSSRIVCTIAAPRLASPRARARVRACAWAPALPPAALAPTHSLQPLGRAPRPRDARASAVWRGGCVLKKNKKLGVVCCGVHGHHLGGVPRGRRKAPRVKRCDAKELISGITPVVARRGNRVCLRRLWI